MVKFRGEEGLDYGGIARVSSRIQQKPIKLLIQLFSSFRNGFICYHVKC